MNTKIWHSKYFKQIFGILFCSTFLLLFIALGALYYTFLHSTHTYLNNVNHQFIKNTLSTIYYQIESTYKNTLNAYTSNNGIALMSAPDTKLVEQLSAMREIDYFLSQDPFICSVYFYSARSDYIYMFGEDLVYSAIDDFFDEEVKQNILNNATMSQQLTARQLLCTPYDTTLNTVLTQYYKVANGDVIVINLNAEKVFGMYQNNPAVYQNAPTNYFVYFDQDELIYSSLYHSDLFANKSQELFSVLKAHHWDTVFDESFSGESFRFNVHTDSENNLQIVSVIQKSDLSESFFIYQIIFGVVLIAAFLVTVFVTVFISKKLYSPIDTIKHLIDDDPKAEPPQNEIEYITTSIADTSSKLEQLFEYKEKNISLSQASFIKDQILYNKYSNKEFWDKCQQKELAYQSGDTFVLLLAHWFASNQEQEHLFKDQALLSYALNNVFQELTEHIFEDIQEIPLDNSEMMFFCKLHGEIAQPDLYDEKLKNIQMAFFQYFDLKLSFFISKPIYNPDEFYPSANLLSELADYQYFYSDGCILKEDSFDWQKRNSELPPLPDIPTIEKALRSANYGLCHQMLQQYFDLLGSYTRESVNASINMFASKIITLLKHIQSSAPAFPNVNYHTFFNHLTQAKSIGSAQQLLLEQLNAIMDCFTAPESDTETLLTKDIIAYLNENYPDYNLSSKSIALKHHISVPYLNRIFKQKTGETIASYLKKLRLEHARTMLVNSNTSVESIAKKVGFENTKYFYTLFKSEYGVSPNNYRISQSLL